MPETMTLTDEIEAILRAESNYALDIKFSHLMAQLTGRAETSVLRMVRDLGSRRQSDISMRGVRDKYAVAMRGACESIWDWYNHADDYAPINAETALYMIESYDPACIWAVIVGQAAKRA